MGPALLAPQVSGGGGGSPITHTFTANTTATTGTKVAATFHLQELASDDDTNHDDPLRARLSGPVLRIAIRCNNLAPTLSGRTITEVKFRIWKESANDLEFQLHRILKNWTQAGIRYSEYAVGAAWDTTGAAAATDVSATLSSSFTAVSNAAGYMEFTGAQLVADVTAFLTTNNGWMLDAMAASSSNQMSQDWDTDGHRVELEVTST